MEHEEGVRFSLHSYALIDFWLYLRRDIWNKGIRYFLILLKSRVFSLALLIWLHPMRDQLSNI